MLGGLLDIDASVGIGACPTASAFLARTSGLDAAHIAAYNSLICGLVSDGVWAKLTYLHIFATQNSTTALLNLVSTSFNGTVNGSPTFTADRGFTGTESGSTDYIDMGFTPSVNTGTPYALDSAHISSWIVSGASGQAMVGSNSGGVTATFLNPASGGLAYFLVNQSALGSTAAASATGHHLGNRSAAGTVNGYRNGSSVMSGTTASVSLPTFPFVALGVNVTGTITGSGYQLAMDSSGASLSAGDVTNFYNRLRTYMTAVGVP